MPRRLRRVLHRAVDLIAHPWHARREARRCPLHPADRRQPLRAVWQARAPGCLCQLAPNAGDVRADERRGADSPHAAGACYHSLLRNFSPTTLSQLLSFGVLGVCSLAPMRRTGTAIGGKSSCGALRVSGFFSLLFSRPTWAWFQRRFTFWGGVGGRKRRPQTPTIAEVWRGRRPLHTSAT